MRDGPGFSSGGGSEISPWARPLRKDIVRAYLGLLVGLLFGLGAAAVTAQYDVLLGLITVYIAPGVFLALFFRIRMQGSPATVARCLGAYGGWLGVWLATSVGFNISYQYGGPLLVIGMLAVIFVLFVPAGMLLGESIQSLLPARLARRG